MARLPLYLNIFMAIATLAVAIYTITIKSQIAVDQRAIARLGSQIQAEEALGEVLRAEWARLQRRDTIEALGVTRFGPGISETAQEINVRDLAQRPQNGNGRAQALVMFQNAVADLPSVSSSDPPQDQRQTVDAPIFNPASHTLTDPDPIAACLRGDPCPWISE